MSSAVMQSTYPTHHCGCDFCNSRRAVNAKKLAVSQMAASQMDAQQRDGCTCQCHKKNKQQNGAPGFNPDFPEPVNQTALNASRGRIGVPGGGYSTKNASTKAGECDAQGGGNDAFGKETADERKAREMAELDGLERLLIAEYKARTRAAMESEQLKAASTNKAARRPQPLPEGYVSDGGQMNDNAGTNGESGTWGRNGPAGSGSYMQNAATIHDAYAMAQECPVTPPVQCHASHRLQDTMNEVRKVTADPINPSNRHALHSLLNKNGLYAGEDGGSETSSTGGDFAAKKAGKNGATETPFGSSLAQIRSSNPHPRGAGVVWVSSTAPLQRSEKDTDVLVVGDAAAASSSIKQPPPLSPSATATGVAAQQAKNERNVTFAA